MIKVKQLVNATAGIRSHGQLQNLCFFCSTVMCLLLSQGCPGDSLTQRTHHIHSHNLAWSHWLGIIRTRPLWLLTSVGWIWRRNCPPHQFIFLRHSSSRRTLGPSAPQWMAPHPFPTSHYQYLRLPGLTGKWPQGISHDPTPYYLFLGKNNTHFLLLSSENFMGRRILKANG